MNKKIIFVVLIAMMCSTPKKWFYEGSKCHVYVRGKFQTIENIYSEKKCKKLQKKMEKILKK